MRKRLVTTLIIAIVSVMCAVCFSACGNVEVAGKTFIFDNVTVSYDGTVSEEDKKEGEEFIKLMKEQSKGSTVVFGTDDKVTMTSGEYSEKGTYVQKDGELKITISGSEQTFTVSGNTIKLLHTEDGITVTMVYKLK